MQYNLQGPLDSYVESWRTMSAVSPSSLDSIIAYYRLRQQLEAYDEKHACIITEQQMRKEIDEVRRELEEQRRLNHKLQVEREVRPDEKKTSSL